MRRKRKKGEKKGGWEREKSEVVRVGVVVHILWAWG